MPGSFPQSPHGPESTGALAGATRPGFRLLFAVMLAIAAGNTALQSVLPAIGRLLGRPDQAIAITFSFSAPVWSLAAPWWARRSDRMGNKAMVAIGMAGFTASLLLCAVALTAGLHGWLSGIGAHLPFVAAAIALLAGSLYAWRRIAR